MSSPVTLSVVIPAFNASATIGTAIESACESIAQAAGRLTLAAEIIVADDGSEDDTVETVARLRPAGIDLIVKRCAQNRGPGPARNAGVRLSSAEYLFFLDADDRYLPSHVAVCLEALVADRRLGWVQTGIELPDFIHPSWKDGIRGSHTMNRCLRRSLHHLVGGFPEHEIFRRSSEDLFYSILLRKFAPGRTLEAVTVRYNERPGNFLDRRRDVLAAPQNRADVGMSEENWKLGDRLLKERIKAVSERLSERRRES